LLEAYHVFMQLCIKLIVEESARYQQSSNWFQSCNGLVSIHFGKTAAAILQGTRNHWRPPGRSSKCWWCVVYLLETLPLTHCRSWAEELCQVKQGIFYIIYGGLRVNIQTSLEVACLSLKEKDMQRRSVLSIPRTISFSTQNLNMENTLTGRLRTLLVNSVKNILLNILYLCGRTVRSSWGKYLHDCSSS
jgi:hypothetical protein